MVPTYAKVHQLVAMRIESIVPTEKANTNDREIQQVLPTQTNVRYATMCPGSQG